MIFLPATVNDIVHLRMCFAFEHSFQLSELWAEKIPMHLPQEILHHLLCGWRFTSTAVSFGKKIAECSKSIV
jgi:hypothetical protein